MEKDWMLTLCHEVLAGPLWWLRTLGLELEVMAVAAYVWALNHPAK